MAGADELEKRLGFLAGNVAALELAIDALIRNHPAPGPLIDAIRLSAEKLIAVATPKHLPDSFLDGLQETIDQMERHLKP
jgi:hypothetical protein